MQPAKANQKKPFPKKKVKTGCRTCKARRVKCGEERPSCLRCVSSGRICDGYGIWGGGGRSRPETVVLPKANPNTLSRNLSRPFAFGNLDPQEESCFRWFRYRTFVKLPLPFISPFWHTLVFQACATEPAVFHAVIALSAAHRKDTFIDDTEKSSSDAEFMLLQYGKAIHHLQPHFSTNETKSLRIALATCALFTFLEYIIGNYDAANTHLLSGLKLLAAGPRNLSYLSENHHLDRSRGFVDDWIIDTFEKLHIQAALLKQVPATFYPGSLMSSIEMPSSSFRSVEEANDIMDRILLKVMQLEERCCSMCTSQSTRLPLAVPDCQESIQAELDSWLDAHRSTPKTFAEGIHPFSVFRYQLLYAYHTMATIMLHACSWPGCEMFYDFQTDNFLLMLNTLVGMWKFHHDDSTMWHHERMTEVPDKVSDATADKGWVPLLYFLGTKCRIRRLRVHALKLLDLADGHKEGAWDSGVSSKIVREVMRIEEDGSHKDLDKQDEFGIFDVPSRQDLVSPSIPEEKRLRNLQVGLPTSPTGLLTLVCEEMLGVDGHVETRTLYYDMVTETWDDMTVTLVERDIVT
ncbi:hypothetical protein F5Y16DRAFT_372308 [Xylariaceae sp. FL0255]|nr:hypothetical protein F5Y16DRAFT_372308 [Xylariaceae sp. FL0255]